MEAVILRVALIIAATLSFGCAARRPAWQLVDRGTTQLLVPPGISNAAIGKRTLTVDMPPGRGPCPTPLRAKGNRIQIKLDQAFLTDRPRGWLTAWTTDLEAKDCLDTGDGPKVALRIAESLPLASDAAFLLPHRNEVQSAQVNLGLNVRLQVVSPAESIPPNTPISEITGTGNSLNVTLKTSVKLSGYETAWYALRPKSKGPGFSIVPISAERHIDGELERLPTPAVNYFGFSASAAFYSLVYKSGQTDYTALVVAGTSPTDLDKRTAMLETDSSLCRTVHREFCVGIPRQVGINSMIAVTVNGAEIRVGLGSSIGGAIRVAGGSPESVLPTLTVKRVYNGHPTIVAFDRANPAILKLLVMGGEVISWRS